MRYNRIYICKGCKVCAQVRVIKGDTVRFLALLKELEKNAEHIGAKRHQQVLRCTRLVTFIFTATQHRQEKESLRANQRTRVDHNHSVVLANDGRLDFVVAYLAGR
jgi:hypothetical protein